jgi:class 3 adenylate cyclase
MPYSIEFQTAGLFFVVVLIIVFFSKPRWQSLQNSIFRVLLPFTAVELIFDIVSVITIAERDHIPVMLNTFFAKGYIIVMDMWIMLSVLYIFSNFLYQGAGEKQKKILKIACFFDILPAVAACVITFIFPLKYANYGRDVYSYGIPSTATYMYSVYCVIISVVGALINFKKLSFYRKVPMLSFTIMEGAAALIQMQFPRLLVIGFGTSVVVFIMYMTMENPDMDMISRLNEANSRANTLLLNILPATIAKQLKERDNTFTANYENVTVAFMDIVDFTKMSAAVGPEKLVNILNALFTEIDSLLDGYKIEKIKTIGDAYMVAAGLPERYYDNCGEMMKFLVAVQKLMNDFNKRYSMHLQLRIGVSNGPVVAGIIGKKKFIYDLWGSTVNFASRMESNGIPDRIQVSQSVYGRLGSSYKFEKRVPMDVKGFGVCTCYLLSRDQNS